MSRVFLVDANLPPALAELLRKQGFSATHVSDHFAADRDDREIWALAMQLHCTLVTKDADFADMVRTSDTGPAVVWLRLGNTRKGALSARVSAILPEIISALDSGERLVEVR